MKIKYSGIIFDLDGTLVNTLGDIAASMNQALKSRGFPEHPEEDFIPRIGWGIKRLAFLSLPEDIQKDTKRGEELALLVSQDAAAYYAEVPYFHSKPYRGICEVLSALKQKKIKTAVLTNKPDSAAQKVIAGLFPAGAFNVVQGEIPGGKRKPDPECVWEILMELELSPASVIFVGDSEIDMETAVSAGCFPLGVEWGYRPRETILKGGARRIIQEPEELLEFFRD